MLCKYTIQFPGFWCTTESSYESHLECLLASHLDAHSSHTSQPNAGSGGGRRTRAVIYISKIFQERVAAPQAIFQSFYLLC